MILIGQNVNIWLKYEVEAFESMLFLSRVYFFKKCLEIFFKSNNSEKHLIKVMNAHYNIHLEICTENSLSIYYSWFDCSLLKWS